MSISDKSQNFKSPALYYLSLGVIPVPHPRWKDGGRMEGGFTFGVFGGALGFLLHGGRFFLICNLIVLVPFLFVRFQYKF